MLSGTGKTRLVKTYCLIRKMPMPSQSMITMRFHLPVANVHQAISSFHLDPTESLYGLLLQSYDGLPSPSNTPLTD
ncbi:hypothetical protein Rcae01_05173 [Novipirellula caenicola]|uniref:Uncharacterized protein n=1 Tax=Novipirellula caenicola TaxID=1536901 RepID=A0ABP9VZL8_9BACT